MGRDAGHGPLTRLDATLARLKDLAAAASGLAAVAYACGYLALRARASALGTDPLLGLLDEAYVFAGFRFVLVTMLALLVGLPVIALVRRVAKRVSLGWLAWIALVLAAFLVLLQLVFVLGVQGLLLKDQQGWLAAAALGENAGGVLATLALTVVAALLALWSAAALARSEARPLDAALLLVAAMQVLLLPVVHGVFFADRQVRRLQASAAVAKGLAPPIAIVDRSKDRVTLLGCSATGERRLVTVAAEALDGTGVVAIEPLRTFLARLSCAATRTALLLAAVQPVAVFGGVGAPAWSAQQADAAPRSRRRARGFWPTLVGYLKVGFENISSLGESGVAAGEVRVVTPGKPGPATVVGGAAGLSWPVIDDRGTVHALRGRQVLRFASGTDEGKPVGAPADWIKLLGVGPDGAVLGLVADGALGRPAMLSPRGALTLFERPASDADRRRVALLRQESRSFADGYELTVDRSGRGFDVFLRSPGGAPVNASGCGGIACGQPSLSPDRARVAYIAAVTP